MTTILIIEDDKDFAELLAERLKEEGYNAFVAFTGSEGIKEIEEINPQCVTLDIHLPDINGIEILKKLKQKNLSLPVVIITSDDTVKKEVLPYHPESFFVKPIDFNKLKNVLKLILKK